MPGGMFDQTCLNLLTFCPFRSQIHCFLRVFAGKRRARMMLNARSSGDNDAVKLSESILTSLRDNLPYRQEPE